MKKILVAILAVMMVLVFVSGALAIGKALAEGEGSEPTALTVGITSRLSGHFFTDKWGANSADIDVRELIHGLNTVAWEQNGNHVLNETVVRELSARLDARTGDKTYRISFNDGLQYNEGTPINAYDYAFSVLLLSSPQFNALGGSPTGMGYFKGYGDYQQGQPFSGVRIIDELTLELTLDGQALPYFYEIALLNMPPYPIHVIAPDCTVKDDGNGAYIAGAYSAELLEFTILDKEAGYLFKPYVTAGAYRFLSFDPETQVAKFERNELFAGDFERVKPTIDEVTVVFADPETALQDVLEGKLDLVNKVSDGAVISEGMSMAEADELSMQNYLRTGMSFISFACEMGPSRSVNVRKAVARCVDVNAVNAEFTRGFGMPVYGYYGMGQWMAMDNQEAMEEYATALDPIAAIGLLKDDGWVLDENGLPYDEAGGGVRYRLNEMNELEKLSLKWAQAEATAISGLLTREISAQAEMAGIELIITKMPFEQLLKHYYRQTNREYHMFSLATNFNLAFDPYETYHTGDEYQGESNKTGLLDEELMTLALAMRQTEVGDNEAYTRKWLEFQARWNEMQPMVPLYSNIYFDFFRPDLQEYYANAYVSWATAIVHAYIGEPALDDSWMDGVAVTDGDI